jgi:cleavage stimulation factor subunit 1
MASCSNDGFIRFYDLVKPSAKKSFRYFEDQVAVLSICFHPSGDFIIAGTQHPSPRIYDVHSLACFIPTTSSSSHEGWINCVRYAPNGDTFATAGSDGTVKIWDAVAGKVLNTIVAPHAEMPVMSVRFSQNSRYLLSCGLDSTGKLWDMTTGKKVSEHANCRLLITLEVIQRLPALVWNFL